MLGAMPAFIVDRSFASFVLGGEYTNQHSAVAVNAEALSALAYTQIIEGNSGNLRSFPVHRVDAIRCADGWHPRNQPDEFHIKMARFTVPWRTSIRWVVPRLDAQAGMRGNHSWRSCIPVPTISGILLDGMRPACTVPWQSLLSMLNNVQWLTKWPKD